MPRHRALTEAQLETLLALPTDELALVQHWTLSAADLAATDRRRIHNRLGFAVQLCALRYPGRLLRSGEVIPVNALRFAAEQVGVEPDALADYGSRFQTRYQQLDALHTTFGFSDFTPVRRREILAWLLPVALVRINAISIAMTLMDE